MATTNDTAKENGDRFVVKTGVVFVARHGERMDYAWRDYEGRNWVEDHVEERPWDPPLTAHGRRQARALGQFVSQQCRAFSVEAPSAIYSSPLLRCCMTAREAALGMAAATAAAAPEKVRLEEGLLESLTGDWFKSWCLEGISDGSWGGGNFTRRSQRDLIKDRIHRKAKLGIESLLTTVENAQKRLWKAEAETGDLGSTTEETREKVQDDDKDNSVLDLTHKTSAVPLVANYRWGTFEKHADVTERLQRLAKVLIHRPESSILLVSHGGPVTCWFEALFPSRAWHEFGHAKYASCSMYRYTIYSTQEVEWEPLVLNNNSYLRELNAQHEEEMETANGLEY